MIEFCSLFFYTYNRVGEYMKIRKIVLCILVLLIGIVALYNDKLMAFANELVYTDDTLVKGLIIKSGESFVIAEETQNARCEDARIPIYLDHDGVIYAAVMTMDGEVTNTKLIGRDIVNYDAFTQDSVGTMPYVDGMEVDWVYTGKEYGLYINAYCNFGAGFVGKVYEEPKFELYCDTTEMKYDEKTDCQVAIDYTTTIKDVEFDLKSEKFNIDDVKVVDGWERTDNNKLAFSAVDIPASQYSDDSVEVDIIEFTIQPKNKEKIDVEDAVILFNTSYVDEHKGASLKEEHEEPMIVRLDDNSTIPNEDDTTEKEEVENPKTGVADYVILGTVVVTFSMIAYAVISAKKIFRKI